ncbi:tape measure domain-containing protein [Phytobacter diazotrophicus]|nr:tape measure domain-containing protein [Phytobacter diazotrophicus]
MTSEQDAGSIVYTVSADVEPLLIGQKQVNERLDQMEKKFDASTDAIGRTEKSMSGLSRVAVSLTAALSVQQVAEYADAWATVNNKLSNSLRPSEQLVDVTERVFNITQQTRSSLDATASLYARLERATRQYGSSADDLSRLTTIINQGFVVSGATAQEAENAIIQLSQGLASGALRGEEFNSVNEQGNRLIVALADSMGVSIGQMRNMAAQGKLTTDVVVKGLLSQGATIGNEFAKTTTTISQALQVAGNNITKFFGENSTVKAGVAVFNDSVISVSENISSLSLVLTAAAAVMGSRYVGALTIATAEKVKAAAAARNQAAAEMASAQATANKAAADLRAATVTKERALDEIRLAEMMKLTAISATNSAAAEQRLSAARIAATAAVANYNRALVASNAAQTAASAGSSLASRALRLVGGAGGAAMLAASAIFYFSQRAKEARDDANNLADGVNELSAKFQTMSHIELSASIAKMSQSLPELSDAVAEAKKEFNDATYAVQFQQKEINNWGTNTTRGRQAAEALGGAQDKLSIATLNLERAQNRLSQTQNAINIGRATLNGTMKQGIDLLRRDGEQAGVAAGMMSQLGNMINFAARAKDKFNSRSLMVDRPKDIQDYLDKQQDQITLQSELNERKRAQLKAEQDIRNLAAKDNASPEDTENYVRLARERAGADFDLEKAEEARRKAAAEAESQGKKSANQAESIAQKLANLKQQSELAADSTQQLSREQAILTAQQSLGKGATQQQIALAGQYAAQKWDTANALKAQAAAEKLLPETKENASYKQDMQDLKTALDAKKITQQQYDQTSEQLEQQHQVNLAKIRAQQAVTPLQSAAGEVDPVQRLANQHAQELALIQQFEQQGVLTHENALALRNAADTQYEQQRIAAQWEIYRNQSQANELLASSLEGLQSGASSALTGLINGTQSLQEAFANIGSTILNSVITSLVQMGIEWVKAQLMGQAAAAASLASTMAQATAAASAWAPAAVSASIATYGSAAAVGQAAYAGSLLSAKGMALAGARYNGGPVSANSMYRVGEGGKPEIFKASNGSQYMIPGDNGRVISNKDMQGNGGGGSVVQHISFEINTTGGIDQATIKQMESMMKRVALFQINDQANRPNGMIQPRRK